MPEMSELLMKYFKGTRRHRGEGMGDFILRKAETYTGAQQSMARYQGDSGRVRREQPSATSMRSTRESMSSQADDGVEANDFQDPVEDQEEQESRQDEWSNQESDSWSSGWWNYQSWSWGRRHGSLEEPDTSEWGKHQLPEILPDFIAQCAAC